MPSSLSKKVNKTTGYTPESVEKLLKSQKSHPIKNWQGNENYRGFEGVHLRRSLVGNQGMNRLGWRPNPSASEPVG